MAEIVGLVSGGAGFVSVMIQVAECAVKLRYFGQRVRSIQGDLVSITHELQDLASTLLDLEMHRPHEAVEADMLFNCLESCKQHVDEINMLVAKLETCISKYSLFGKLCATMRSDTELKKLVDDLGRAKSNIRLALATYSLRTSSQQYVRAEERHLEHAMWHSENRAFHNVLLGQMRALERAQSWPSVQISYHLHYETEPESPTICGSPAPELAESEYVDTGTDEQGINATKDLTLQQQEGKRWNYYKRISFLSRLTGYMWDLALRRSCSGWGLNLDMWNVRPFESAIFRHCRLGDVESVKDLISLGKASALDIDNCGYTLLDHAARSSQVEVCRFLLQHTIFPKRSNVILNALDKYAFRQRGAPRTFFNELDMYSTLLERSSVDVDLDENSWRESFECCHDEDCVKIIMRKQTSLCLPNGQSHNYVEIMNMLSRSWLAFSPDVVLAWFGMDHVTPELAELRSSQGFTALHAAAIAVIYWMYKRTPVQSEMLWNWRMFLRDVLSAGADCFALWQNQTPLLAALRRSLNDRARWGHVEDLDVAATISEFLRDWNAEVYHAGVDDLLTYWDKEENIWQQKACERPKYDASLFATAYFTPHLVPLYPIFYAAADIWTLAVVRLRRLQISQLELPLSAWNVPQNPITKIIWRPDRAENEEGEWVETDVTDIKSPPFAMIAPGTYESTEHLAKVAAFAGRLNNFNTNAQKIFDESEYFPDLLKTYQDDHDPIALRMLERPNAFKHKRRSISQPPPIERREVAYTTPFEHYGEPRDWLRCHLCPRDNRWRFLCTDMFIGQRLPMTRLRICMRADSIPTSAQETEEWDHYNVVNGERWHRYRESWGALDRYRERLRPYRSIEQRDEGPQE